MLNKVRNLRLISPVMMPTPIGMSCTVAGQVLGFPVPGTDCTPVNATAALVGIDMPQDLPAVQAAAVALQVGGAMSDCPEQVDCCFVHARVMRGARGRRVLTGGA